MQLSTGPALRMGQQMKLSPRLIQSMEVLQMPQAQLEARIEQELGSNPLLDVVEATPDREAARLELEQAYRDDTEAVRELDLRAGDGSGTDDFERLSNFSEAYGEDYAANTQAAAPPDTAAGRERFESGRSATGGRASGNGERDGKMDAMANAAQRTASLYDQLSDQWRMVELDPEVHAVGQALIGLIDADGYLRPPPEELALQLAQSPEAADTLPEGLQVTPALIRRAIHHLQLHLEPPGMAAADLRESLLLQIEAKLNQDPDADADSLNLLFNLVDEHLPEIEGNRLPRIAKAMELPIDDVQAAIRRLRQFHPHPGRLIADDGVRTITPDAVIEYDEETGTYTASLTHSRIPPLRIDPTLAEVAEPAAGVAGEATGDGSNGRGTAAHDKATRDFIRQNLESARWLMDAIQQRNSTLLRVIAVVLNAQHAFFEQGPEALRPLPMTAVADQLGVHVATVSRAVSEKYLQTPRGILPLRMFFSGGTESEDGEAMSWAAVQQKLKNIIDAEDKQKPLSDEALVRALKKEGITLARRTVAKYRDQMGIPAARQRKQYV